MDLGAELLLTLEVYLAIALPAAVVAIYLQRGAPKWLPLPRLRRGRWSGSEVFLTFLLFQIVPSLLVLGLDEAGFFFIIFGEHVKHGRQLNVLTPLIVPLLFAIFLWLLHRSSQTHPAHVGFTPARWRGNVRLGLTAYCVVTPVILGIHSLMLLTTTATPHAFEEMAKKGIHDFEWLTLAGNAIVAAPLLEEWLFRGLLQGWLRRASPWGHLVIAVFALVAGSAPFFQSIAGQPNQLEMPAAEMPILWESFVFAIVVVGIYAAGVLRLWWPVYQNGLGYFVEQPAALETSLIAPLVQVEGQTPVLVPAGPRLEAFKIANARWAIVGSAMIFALMHSAWPSPVALLPLGLVLGWLAYRTQSLIPGLVLHALFNAVAFAVLALSVER